MLTEFLKTKNPAFAGFQCHRRESNPKPFPHVRDSAMHAEFLKTKNPAFAGF
jgi:hypothetical protein